MNYQLLQGDCLQTLRTLPAESVHVCITSPPYFGLRSYLHNEHDDKHMEIGSEPTVEAYVARLVDVFREVRRVLHPTGTVFLNLGDSYAGANYRGGGIESASDKQRSNTGTHEFMRTKQPPIPSGCKPKDLIGIPWMVAFALRADGWYLRSEIIWHKRAPMPESVTDRPTKAHEQVFLLAKNATYYYDHVAIMEPGSQDSHGGGRIDILHSPQKVHGAQSHKGLLSTVPAGATGRNKRSVWTLGPEPSGILHYATFPTKLVEPMVLAGTSAYGCCAKCLAPWERVVERTNESTWQERKANGADSGSLRNGHNASHGVGVSHELPSRETVTTGWAATCTCAADVIPCTVLDCFSGAATVGVVATKFGRRYIGCELNADYINLSITRLEQVQPMLMDVTP